MINFIQRISQPFYRLFRPLYVPMANVYHRLFKAPRRYHHLYDTIAFLKAERIMEIGVWNGARAVRMIETAKASGVAVPEYYGFDLFESLGEDGYYAELSKRPPTEAEVKELLAKTGAQVHIYRGNTLETLQQAVPQLPKMDFVFLDGGHSLETIANDWRYVQEVMGETTVVIFDDYWHNRTDGGSKKTVDSIDRSVYEVEMLPETDSFDNPEFGHIDISFARVKLRRK